jgi:non-heme chloroperoxidase
MTAEKEKPIIQELLQESLPGFERDLKALQDSLDQSAQDPIPPPSAGDMATFAAFQSRLQQIMGLRFPESELHQQYETKADGGVGKRRSPQSVGLAIIAGEQKYTEIGVPILAFYAIPHDGGPLAYKDASERTAAEAREAASAEPLIKAFESGLPSARIVRLPHTHHYIFLADEADVLREMDAFLVALPK